MGEGRVAWLVVMASAQLGGSPDRRGAMPSPAHAEVSVAAHLGLRCTTADGRRVSLYDAR